MNVRKILNTALRPVGYELARRKENPKFPQDFTEEEQSICTAVRPFTMAREVDKIYPIIGACRHVSEGKVPGAIVECGVWRGGMMMAAAFTLKALNRTDRDLYLFDTFAGMVEPTEHDKDVRGNLAEVRFKEASREGEVVDWCYASLPEVKKNMQSTGYPSERMHFIQGKVEETIPQHAPEKIAILRLDTDWYESSLHEMIHLYPRLQRGGVLILDDYGFWQGSRKATDEYFARHNIAMHLVRVDSACRVGVKVD
jgi:O-methyltransferase